MQHLPSILQLLGLALFAVVAYLLNAYLGGAVLAVELFIIGLQLERR